MKRKGVYLADPVCQAMVECVFILKRAGTKFHILDDAGNIVKKRISETSYISKAIEILNMLLLGDKDQARRTIELISPDLFEAVPDEETKVSVLASEHLEPHK